MIPILLIATTLTSAGWMAGEGQRGDPGGQIQESRPLAEVSTEALVDRLVEESAEGIGSQTTSWAIGFLAIDEEPRFAGGILGSAKPTVSPIMRELVRRGVAALPTLIQHLTDARPTRLVVGDGFMGKWFGDEYDRRDPKKQAIGTNRTDRADHDRKFDRYTLKVGDLCYVAVGQIVNRDLLATRYQLSLCLVVNSPVETPALAAAVKADWEGLTPKEHEQSLRQDALISAPSAVVRLLYYYPRTGEALVIQMLDRPFYDRQLVFTLFDQQLMEARDESEWGPLLSEFRTAHGEANYRGLLSTLAWASTFPKPQRDEYRERSKKVADAILARFFPWFDPIAPPFLDAVDYREQRDLIQRLGPFPSRDFDRAILGVFRRCLATRPTSMGDRIERGDLARACVDRLGRGIPRQECLKFFEVEIQELREARRNPENSSFHIAIDQRIEMTHDLINRLTKAEAK